jgi:protein-disulfide isomerase
MAIAAGVAAIVAGALVFGAGALRPDPAGVTSDAAVRNYLMTNPEVLFDMENELERRARQQALQRVGADSLTNPMVAYVHGPADADVTVVEFFDYHCGYCKASLPAMQAALADNPDVRFAFIEYPILTDNSVVAARAAVASRRQGELYMPFHIAMMSAQGDLTLERIMTIAEDIGLDVERLRMDMEDPTVNASIDASLALARELHVNGTPTFVINGNFHIGHISAEMLNGFIDANQG